MNSALSKLPLFATDDEIAIAIVGKQRASSWKRGALRLLEARGFPQIDHLHGGRPVPLIEKWYRRYLALDENYIQASPPPGQEHLELWRPKRDQRGDRKPKLDLDSRCQKILLYMIAHPDAQTHVAIPDAGAVMMQRLAEKGAITAGKKDRDGDTIWAVSEVGLEEAKRLDYWYRGKS